MSLDTVCYMLIVDISVKFARYCGKFYSRHFFFVQYLLVVPYQNKFPRLKRSKCNLNDYDFKFQGHYEKLNHPHVTKSITFNTERWH